MREPDVTDATLIRSQPLASTSDDAGREVEGSESAEGRDGAYILYTAVLPRYRQACLEVLADELGPSFRAFAGGRHLDATVRTDIADSLYTGVVNRGLFGRRLLLQTGHWRPVLRAQTAVLDLNPRSVTAWILLILRRSLGRRTLVWGHLYPQRGAADKTAGLRRLMRNLSSGTILYGYDSTMPALQDSPGGAIWVAPNALYRTGDLGHVSDARASTVLYVGRLEPAKNVDRLLTAYASAGLAKQGIRLAIVGDGSALTSLVGQAAALGITDTVDFIGPMYGTDRLREAYARAVVSVSPGYAGLNLTQSIGFGVPVLVSRHERHSPEIELAATGAVTFFDTHDTADFALQLCNMIRDRPSAQTRENWRSYVRRQYSAEAMSDGLVRAFRNQRQELTAG